MADTCAGAGRRGRIRRMKGNRCRDLLGGLLVAMLAVLLLSPLWDPIAYRAYDRRMASLGYGTTVPNPYKEILRVVSEAEARAAARGEPPVWPTKGQWRTSSDFLRSVLPRNLRKRVVGAGAGKTCCLLAGARRRQRAGDPVAVARAGAARLRRRGKAW